MKIDYSGILSKAWTITWKYKILWFFGFLAMLGGSGSWNGSNGSGGASGPNLSYNLGRNEIDWRHVPPEWGTTFEQLERIDVNTWISIIAISVCCLLLLGLALWLLGIIGRGGLISGIVSAETTGRVDFRETWNAGLRCFLRLFLIRLLGFAVGLLMAVVVILPGTFLILISCGMGFLPVTCLMIVIGIAVNLWFAFMDYAVVVEDRGIGGAIGRAWTVLRNHIGPVLIFWIILFAISLIVGIGLLILAAPSAMFFILGLLPFLTEVGTINTTLLIIGAVLLVLFILVAIVVNTIYTVWETAVMTLAYRTFGEATPMLTVSEAGQPSTAG